jgi:predicted alpha/beta hydrolase family esterase
MIKKTDKLCFVGHSLGPLFILHAVTKYNLHLDSAIFVSPFLDKLQRSWQIDHVNSSFYKIDFDFDLIKKLIPTSYVIYSDDDPYVHKNYSLMFAHALGSSTILVKRGGHMNSEVNLNEFSLVFDLCLTRLDLPLYQRYLMTRQKLGAINYVESTKGNVVKLAAKDALDEGVFRWRYMEKYGFVTLFTGIMSFWDPKSQYMQDARKAAKRAELTRVIIAEKESDLKNPVLHEQVKLDLVAGIRVYLCFYKDIQDVVPEPDFGVFDDSYVCIVPFDKEKQTVGTIELNSQEKVVQQALEWRKYIVDRAQKIESAKDLERFANRS